jgi:hypothetical protein
LSEWVITKLGPDVPLHFTAFHPRSQDDKPVAHPEGTLRMACDIACAVGLPLRLYWQRQMTRGPKYVLRRRASHRPRLVPNHPVAIDGEG